MKKVIAAVCLVCLVMVSSPVYACFWPPPPPVVETVVVSTSSGLSTALVLGVTLGFSAVVIAFIYWDYTTNDRPGSKPLANHPIVNH